MYGITFNFTTFKKKEFISKFGALISLASAAIFLLLFIFFGWDFFHGTAPFVNISSYDYRRFPIYSLKNTQNFPIAWRFEDEKKILIMDLMD